METKEINSTSWASFCKQFEAIRPRTRLSIERINHDGKRERVVENVELQSARLDRSDACNDVINLTLAEDSGEVVEYTITEPIRIKLRQEDSSRYNMIEITAEDGTHLLVARSGFRPDLLESIEG